MFVVPRGSCVCLPARPSACPHDLFTNLHYCRAARDVEKGHISGLGSVGNRMFDVGKGTVACLKIGLERDGKSVTLRGDTPAKDWWRQKSGYGREAGMGKVFGWCWLG